MIVLGIESSCDETSAALVEAESRTILSNVVASQIEIHRLYGGVVPEIASRAHAEAIWRVTDEAFRSAVRPEGIDALSPGADRVSEETDTSFPSADRVSEGIDTSFRKIGMTPEEIDAVAVTCHPGLIGALLVGVSFAKGFAYRFHKPIVGVNHVHGHAAAAYFADPALDAPFLALVASGGHTSMMNVNGRTGFETVGVTRDDAIGEAFDKVARVMGLPYPGGKEMDALAAAYTPDLGALPKFPSAAIADDTLDFSFSGLKTAVINHIHTLTQKGIEADRRIIAAAFTQTVVDSVLKKLEAALALTNNHTLVVAGGVAANSHLRAALARFCREHGVRLVLPDLPLCGDNGAMIAMQGAYEYAAGHTGSLSLTAYAGD